VQRRQALQQLKDDPVTAPRFTHIVPTLYADYRLGILLSWIDGELDSPVDPAADRPAIYYSGSLRRTGADGGDLCSGNLLVDRQEQLWLFDFAICIPSTAERIQQQWSGRPLFHFVERFETRFFFSWLMTRILTPNSSWRNIAR
jgi:hypothetical protein